MKQQGTVFIIGLLILSVLTAMPVMAQPVDDTEEMPVNEIRIMTNGDDGDSETLCTDVDLIFIMDCSGTMLTNDSVVGGTTVTRIAAAKTAAKEFINLLPTDANTRVGVVSYETYGNAKIEQSLTTDFGAARSAIDSLSITGWSAMTSIGEGFKKGKDELQAHGGTNKRIFLLLTDGLANSYPSGWSAPAGWISPPGTWETEELYAFVEAHDAMTLDAENPTKIYTVGMGEQSSIDEDFLEVLAYSSGGEYFFAGTTAVSKMFKEVRADICLGDVTVLILTNFPRMGDLGYMSLLDSDPIVGQLTAALQDLADNNPNGRGAIVDLGYLGDTTIDTAYSNWDGHEGDVTLTNNLVDAIDDYIEDQKQDEYPLLRYVIFVGSHEIIPMKARADDYQWWINPPGYWLDEKHWADGLPQTSGCIYDLAHAGTNGSYLTDTIYSDLSYRDTTADHELTPELSVARIVETPQQILGVIEAYMDNNGAIPKDHFVSMASYDYVDGGTLSSDYMAATGVTTNDTLVDCAYDSTDIPPLLNAQHDIAYLAGHGEYNWITTTDTRDGVSASSDGFMAGNSATHGDTNGINPIDGAVIITSGCHNGVNFGNVLYHAPDAGTTYHGFPEDFAARGVVAYVGASGYTVISGTKCRTNTSETGYNEKLSANVVYYVVNGVDIGRAFRNGAKDYYRALSSLGDWDRRVLAIPTLYGIPTYKDPPAQLSTKMPKTVTALQKQSYVTTPIPTTKPTSISEKVTLIVSDYEIEPSGIVRIPGVEQVVSYNKPIVPERYVEKTLPRGSRVYSIEWNEAASESVVVTNNIPIAGIACKEASFPGNFYFDGFWPVSPYNSYDLLTFGAGGSEVGFGVFPVQYNAATGETKIWTKMVFDVIYDVPDTGISIVTLSTDKGQYPSDDDVGLTMGLHNRMYTRLVDLNLIMRDHDTSDEIITMDVGTMGLEGGVTTEGSYLVYLGDIPSYQIEGRTIEAELIVSDPHNGDILASKSVVFDVQEAGVREIFFSTEEDFEMQGPEPADGNPVISDGDLLCSNGTLFLRNQNLLAAFNVDSDLGLDAADVIAAKIPLVAFSTELDDPEARFTAGDLLVTNGAIIPNRALMAKFDIPEADLGLDAVQFIGESKKVITFVKSVAEQGDGIWNNPEVLPALLERQGIDIWFSTEGTAPEPEAPLFLDGDLLSVCKGTVVVANADLLPLSVPAGIPNQGVDFGLDAVIADRTGNEEKIWFSTDILYDGETRFTDGDVLLIGNGVVRTNEDLIQSFKPKSNFLGLDALAIVAAEEEVCRPSIKVYKKAWDMSKQAWAKEISTDVQNTVTFQSEIINNGTCGPLYNIKVTDILSDSLEYANYAQVNSEPREPDAVNDKELTWFFESPLNPNETITIKYNARVVSCGEDENVQRVEAVCEKTGTEVYDEDRATVIVPCVEVEKPDLVITHIGAVGESQNILYTIQNQGNAEAGPSWTELRIDGVHIMKDSVGSLAPGAMINRTFDYTPDCPTGEEVEITVCADIGLQVDESDEGNNCKADVWTCTALPTKLDIYFADAKESPGSVYHYDTSTEIEETVYTRPSRNDYLSSFTFHPEVPEKLYYVSINENKIYRTTQLWSGWTPEEVVYPHNTYVSDIAFAFDENGELGLYFSESSGARENGKIYKIEGRTATPFYEVKLADVGGFWAGDFAFDDRNNLYLSSGNHVPASIYKVDGGKVKEIFKDQKEAISGLAYKDGSLYYANWGSDIYQLDLSTGGRTAIYSNPVHTRLSDVGF
jgi:hypothetical protein